MKPSDLLLCVFSYNMGATLDNCLEYIRRLCPEFDVVLIDDDSTDPATIETINRRSSSLKAVFFNRSPKAGKRHGNLYDNIQQMCSYAAGEGYKYLFLIQDDMQFVRPLSNNVLAEYRMLFESDDMLLQVDPRFLRHSGSRYEVLSDIGAYKNDTATSYADVGIIHLERFNSSGVRLREGERVNRDAFAALGYKRVFPFTPVIMHVPFPQRYRQGKRKKSLLTRGRYGFHEMSADDMWAMDEREVDEFPYFRKYLRVRNMRLGWLIYYLRKDSRVFA